MSVEFTVVTSVPANPEGTFNLSRDIDEHQESLSRTRERAIFGRTSGLICLGETVTWRAIYFGLPFRLTSIITVMESPNRFVDEQLRGPFRWFRHEHQFFPAADGTTMIDTVSFAAPFGPLGRIVERIVLERTMRRVIADRNAHLVALAHAETTR